MMQSAKRRPAVLATVGVVAVVLLSGCNPTPTEDTRTDRVSGSTRPTAVGTSAPSQPDSGLLALGRKVYNFRCYYCHGYSGDAKTLAATYVSPPPRNFSADTPDSLPLAQIEQAVAHGKAGTAMRGFGGVIPSEEVKAVSAFVFDEFVVRKATNTRYHTPENGWPNHERYQAAYPFALGEIPLTQPTDQLTPVQLEGLRLYLGGCVTCHDRGKPTEDPVVFEARPVSYPRFNFDHRNPKVDASTSATPYHLHDIPPQLKAPTPLQQRGQALYQDNCAFCHAADGTGKNWIGAFLEPHPRNLTDAAFMTNINRDHLRRVIRDGLPGTSMPAWKAVLKPDEIDAIIAYIDKAFHPVAN